MKDEARRNLLEGWCQEGERLSDAVQRVNPDTWDGITADFTDEDCFELNAARLLYAFTGLTPTCEDRQSGQGVARNRAVDIKLTHVTTNEVQVVEVTRSLDEEYESLSRAVEGFEQAVNGAYAGEASWDLKLKRGWQQTQLKSIASTIATHLNQLAREQPPASTSHVLHPYVTACPSNQSRSPKVTVDSDYNGILNLELPYLEALSNYLATDPVMLNRLDKLKPEARTLHATHSHLFIGMGGMGKNGGLLPTTPSYFTWGSFTPPESLTDLWLYGGTGELYHWARESGWVFHNLNQ